MLSELKVKICGLCGIENLLDVAAQLPDFIGLVFAPDSPRFVKGRLDPEELREESIVPDLIGVFVNAPKEEILEAVDEFNLQGVQLHGNEPAQSCAELRVSAPRLIIIKAFQVDDSFDFQETAPHSRFCDYFLFDAPEGGSGKIFDWRRLTSYEGATPFFLAGGLGVSQLKDIRKLAATQPRMAGVDASTKLERAPGLKDGALVQSFIEGVRQ